LPEAVVKSYYLLLDTAALCEKKLLFKDEC